MSEADLNALEREVELTRAKFANDLARLRSPHTLAEFKEDLWAHARDTKNGIVAELKARAAANPAAVAALAAGLGWRLFHRPPIATALVGLGLFSLLRTSPSQADYARAEDFFDPDEWTSRASTFADAAKQKVQDLSAQAAQAAHDAKTQVAEAAASAAERASDALRYADDTTRDRVARLAEDAASNSERASSGLRAAMPERDDRDNLLLGAAALAVTVAIGLAVQRRAHEQRAVSMVD
jgi:hypothetical protein